MSLDALRASLLDGLMPFAEAPKWFIVPGEWMATLTLDKNALSVESGLAVNTYIGHGRTPEEATADLRRLIARRIERGEIVPPRDATMPSHRRLSS